MCSVHSEHNERHTHNVLWAAPGVEYLRAYSLAKEAMLRVLFFFFFFFAGVKVPHWGSFCSKMS